MTGTARGSRQASYAKSADTELRILEAAVDCLCEDGLHAISLQRVADRAGVTRSCVQYYARTTQALLDAVQAHVVDRAWGDDLRRSRDLAPGSDRFARGLDLAFQLPQSRYFIAWNELLAGARTDARLREVVMRGARLREEIHDALFGEFHADVPASEVARLRSMDDLVVMALHAAAFVRFSDDEGGARIARALDLLKRLTLESFGK